MLVVEYDLSTIKLWQCIYLQLGTFAGRSINQPKNHLSVLIIN